MTSTKQHAATIHVESTGNLQGSVRAVKRIVSSRFSSSGRQITIREEHDKGKLLIYGQVSEVELQGLDGLDNLSRIGVQRVRVEYHANSKSPEEEMEELRNAAREANEQLWIKVAEIVGLRQELSAEKEKANKADEFGLTQFARTEELERQIENLEGRLTQGPRGVNETMVTMLTQYAGKVSEADAALGDEIFTVTNFSLDALLERVNAIGLGSEATTRNDAEKIVAEYFRRPGAAGRLMRVYAAQQGSRAAEYESAPRKNAALQAQILKFESDKTLDRRTIDELVAVCRRNVSQNSALIQEYEAGRQAFVDHATVDLEQCSNELLKQEKQAELKKRISEILGGQKIPVYISLGREKDSYVFSIVLPVKSGQASRILDVALCERILTQEIMAKIKVEDVLQGIKESEEPQSGLRMYTVTLPASGYTTWQIIDLEKELERAVCTAYSGSPLVHFGMEIAPVFHPLVQFRESAEQPNGRTNTSRQARAEVIAAILDSEGRLKSPEIAEHYAQRTGERIDRNAVRSILTTELGDRIDVNGRGRATTYGLLRPEQQ